MGEDSQQDQPEVTGAVPSGERGARALDLTGGMLGLTVFIAGVVLVILTYRQAVDLYKEIPAAIDAARIGAHENPPQIGTDSAAKDNSSSTSTAVVARPGGRPLAKVATDLGLRFLALVLIGFLGFLVAAMGAKLAGAHRGKRT
ncbi:MAG: hypothetical protein ACUVX8_11920 [Candidatus Zipacnadales bacterium]